jgi:hypothetical protein
MCIAFENIKSQMPIYAAKMATLIITTIVEPTNSFLVGHDTFLSSTVTSLKKLLILANIYLILLANF